MNIKVKFTNLEQLNLSMTKVTDKGRVHLKALKQLKQLYLIGTRVTGKGVKDVKKVLPGCQVFN